MNKNNGLKHSPSHIRDYSYGVCCAADRNIELPTEFELPLELLPPIYDQGKTSKCVAYTMCECVESKLIEEDRWIQLSPSWVYARDEGRNGLKDEGMFISTAINGAIKIGFVPHLYFEFDDVDVPKILDIAKERDDLIEIGQKIRPSAYLTIPMYACEDRKWEEIKRALYVHKSPLVAARKGHAIMVYGYTERNGIRKLKYQNSYGKDWGKGGRSEIDLDDIVEAYVLLWEDLKHPFTDVCREDWFSDDVRSAYFSGLIAGTSEDKFSPSDNIIRGDTAIIISRLLDKFQSCLNAYIRTQNQEGESVTEVEFLSGEPEAFNDIVGDDYYRDAVVRACANGIMTGVSQSRFLPRGYLTRAEAATIVVRTAEKLRDCINGIGLKKCSLQNVDMVKSHDDIEEYAWYSPYVVRAIQYGLMFGNGDGTFSPDESITRAEATAIFNRLFRLIDKLLEQIA